jgi:hypothetical protein
MFVDIGTMRQCLPQELFILDVQQLMHLERFT